MKQIEIWIQIYHLHFDWLQEYLGTIVVVVAEEFVSFLLALCRKIIHLPYRNAWKGSNSSQRTGVEMRSAIVFGNVTGDALHAQLLANFFSCP